MCYVKHFVNIYKNLVRIPYESVQTTFVRTFCELITRVSYETFGHVIMYIDRNYKRIEISIIYYI